MSAIRWGNDALLVSLEQYLNDDGQVSGDQRSLYVTGHETGKPLEGGDALDDDEYVRLVVLTRWSVTVERRG